MRRSRVDDPANRLGFDDRAPGDASYAKNRVLSNNPDRAYGRKEWTRPRAVSRGPFVTGEVTEWPKVHDWKSCVPARVPRVRIPPSPLIFRQSPVLNAQRLVPAHGHSRDARRSQLVEADGLARGIIGLRVELGPRDAGTLEVVT